jgi:hypothetical protein
MAASPRLETYRKETQVSDEQEYVSADELMGGLIAAEGASDFKPPTDVLLAMRPLGHKQVTAAGVAKPFDAVEAYTIVVGDDEYEDLGIRDVAWQFVIRELDKATEEAPWIVGTVTKKSRAYFLTPPTPEQMKGAAESVASLIEDKRAEEEAQKLVSAAFGTEGPAANPVTDEEPF